MNKRRTSITLDEKNSQNVKKDAYEKKITMSTRINQILTKHYKKWGEIE